MTLGGVEMYPHLVPISQDPAYYPAQIRRELYSVVERGGQLVVVNWDPDGGQFNHGRLQLVVEYKGRLVQRGGSGWVDSDDHFTFQVSTSGPLDSEEATTIRRLVASVGTREVLQRLAPWVRWEIASNTTPPRRWVGLCGDTSVAAWLDDHGLNVKLGPNGAVVGPAGAPVVGLEGDDLVLETLRRAGVLKWAGDA